MAFPRIPDSCKIEQWHNLPCLLTEEYAVLFSYVGDNLVCTRVSKEFLNSPEIFEEVQKSKLLDCLSETGQKEIIVKQVTLCLTERCNCKCKYCFLDANTTGSSMSIETMHRSLDFAFNKYRGHLVILSAFGGEPGTREDLIREMVRYAESRKDHYDVAVQYAITTNGVISDSLIQFLIEWRFVCTLSVDGVEVVQNYQRPLANGTASFPRVHHTMRLLADAGLYLKVRSTVTAFSAPFMEESVHFWGKLGVRQIHFEPVTPAGRALSDNEGATTPPSPEEYGFHILNCIDVAREYNAKINFSFCSRCTGIMKNKMIVGANGMISSCVEVQSDKHEFSDFFRVGEVNPDSGEINEYASKIVATAPEQYFRKEKCSKCPYKIFCRESCPIRNYRATGDFHQTEPFKCDLYHCIMPDILYNLYLTTYSNS